MVKRYFSANLAILAESGDSCELNKQRLFSMPAVIRNLSLIM
jgi:hypothetical protein